MSHKRGWMGGDGAGDWRTAPVGVLLVTTLLHTLSATCMFTFAALSPTLTAALDIGAATIGYIAGAGFAFGSAASVAVGAAIVRHGAARMLQVGLFLLALGGAVVSCASVTSLSIGVSIIGIGYGMVSPTSSVLLSQFCRPERRNFDFSIKQAATPAGTAIAGFLAPFIASRSDWPWAYVAVAVVSGAMAAAIFWLRDRWDVARQPSARLSSPLGGVGVILSTPRLARLAFMGFLFSSAQVGTTAYLALYVVDYLDHPIAFAGLLLSLSSIAGLCGRFIIGYLADRAPSSAHVLCYTGTVAALTVGLFAAITPAWPEAAIFLLVVLFGIAGHSWAGIYQAALTASAPQRLGEVVAGSFGFMFLGAVAGPMLAGLVLAITASYPLVFLTLGLAAAVGAALIAVSAFFEG